MRKEGTGAWVCEKTAGFSKQAVGWWRDLGNDLCVEFEGPQCVPIALHDGAGQGVTAELVGQRKGHPEQEGNQHFLPLSALRAY